MFGAEERKLQQEQDRCENATLKFFPLRLLQCPAHEVKTHPHVPLAWDAPQGSLELVGRRPLSNCLSPSALLGQFSFAGYEEKNLMRITDTDSSAHLGPKILYFQPFCSFDKWF